MLSLTWFTVDGCYWRYWSGRAPQGDGTDAGRNVPASLSLSGMCGLGWRFRGRLREFVAAARQLGRDGTGGRQER